MAKPTANEIFRGRYGNSLNIMTPDVLKRGLRGGFAYELSKGEGFRDRRTGVADPLFGVTVLNLDGTTPEPSRNRCFQSRRAAEAYIRSDFAPELGEN